MRNPRRLSCQLVALVVGVLLLAPGLLQAAAWRSDITHRPRLLYRAEQRDVIRARLTRSPYSTLLSRVRSGSNPTPSYPGTFTALTERANAHIAKNCALLYDMEGDSAKAAKAAEILRNINTNVGSQPVQDLDNVQYLSDAVSSYCIAYDLLAGAGYVTDGGTEYQRLATLAANYYNYYWSTIFFAFQVDTRNKRLKAAAALGMCGLTCNQHNDASTWMNNAVGNLGAFLNDRLSGSDGGYAEGPWYLEYSGATTRPFLIALHRMLGDASGSYAMKECGSIGWPCSNRNVVVQDFLLNPKYRLLEEWPIRLRLPDGSRPDIDDANQHYPVNGMLAGGAWSDGPFLWDWLAGGRGLSSNWGADLSVEMLALLDDSTGSEPPSWPPTQFLPGAGQAVLRSGWGTDARYFLLLAENGAQRTEGGGHEHPDPLSFIFYAKGQRLLIDSGYGSYSQRTDVSEADNHNLILVDGNGPAAATVLSAAGEDSYLENTLDTDFLDYAEARTSYHGASIRRHALFADHQYVVLVDEVSAGSSKTYTSLFHGNGGGNTGGTFSLTGTGGTWSNGPAKVSVHTTTTRGLPTFTSSDDIHSWVYQRMDSHTVLRAAITASTVRYVSLLLPQAASQDTYTVTSLGLSTGKAGWKLEGGWFTDLVATQESTGTIAWGLPDNLNSLSTDAKLLHARFLPGSGWQSVLLKEATSAILGGEQVLTSASSVSLALKRSASGFSGYALSGGTITLEAAFPPLSASGATLGSVSEVGGRFRFQLTLTAKQSFEVLLSPDLPTATPTHTPSSTPTASATPSPSPNPSPTSTPSSSPSATATLSPTPSPTPSPSPSPSSSPTSTQTPSPTPTPTSAKPKLYLAGYLNTRLSAGVAGQLKLMAFSMDTNGEAALSTVQLHLGGVPSGLHLDGVGDGFFLLPYLRMNSPSPARYLLELRGSTADGTPTQLWPYLTVE